jgi:hypothetical protein
MSAFGRPQCPKAASNRLLFWKSAFDKYFEQFRMLAGQPFLGA